MADLATFNWSSDSWEDVRNLGGFAFAERYGVPSRVVQTLLRKRALSDYRPVQYRLDPPTPEAIAAGRIARLMEEDIDRIVDEVIPLTPEQQQAEAAQRAWEVAEMTIRDAAYRLRYKESSKRLHREERLQRRRLRKKRRQRKLEAGTKTDPAYYACRATHHEHCKGKGPGRKPCGCICHRPKHTEWRLRRLRAWLEEHPPEVEAPLKRPKSVAELMRSNRAWRLQQRDLDEIRAANRARAREQRGPGPSLSSHALSEEDVEAIVWFADHMTYQWGRSRDVWIAGLGDEEVAAFERLSHYTDPRAKTDLWWKHERVYWWAHYPVSKERQVEYSRERRQRFRDEGLCTHCGKEPRPGRRSCARCAERMRLAGRKYQARLVQQSRERYQARRAEGLCGTCGEQPEDDGAMCEACRVRHRGRADLKRARTAELYWGRRAKGLCGHCGAPAREDRAACVRCTERTRQQKSRYERRLRRGYPRLRNMRRRLATALAARNNPGDSA